MSQSRGGAIGQGRISSSSRAQNPEVSEVPQAESRKLFLLRIVLSVGRMRRDNLIEVRPHPRLRFARLQAFAQIRVQLALGKGPPNLLSQGLLRHFRCAFGRCQRLQLGDALLAGQEPRHADRVPAQVGGCRPQASQAKRPAFAQRHPDAPRFGNHLLDFPEVSRDRHDVRVPEEAVVLQDLLRQSIQAVASRLDLEAGELLVDHRDISTASPAGQPEFFNDQVVAMNSLAVHQQPPQLRVVRHLIGIEGEVLDRAF